MLIHVHSHTLHGCMTSLQHWLAHLKIIKPFWLQILDKGAAWNDAGISPVVRQSLLHWAYELTEEHYKKMAKEVQKS